MEARLAPAYEPGLLNFMGIAEGLRPPVKARDFVKPQHALTDLHEHLVLRVELAEGHLVIEVQRDQQLRAGPDGNLGHDLGEVI